MSQFVSISKSFQVSISSRSDSKTKKDAESHGFLRYSCSRTDEEEEKQSVRRAITDFCCPTSFEPYTQPFCFRFSLPAHFRFRLVQPFGGFCLTRKSARHSHRGRMHSSAGSPSFTKFICTCVARQPSPVAVIRL